MKLAVFVPLLLIVLVQLQATNGVSTVTVMVWHGLNLRGHDIGRKPNAYVTVINGINRGTTRVIYNNNNPIWVQTFIFTPVYSSLLEVQVWDKDKEFNDRLGRCTFLMARGAIKRLYTCWLISGGSVWIYYSFSQSANRPAFENEKMIDFKNNSLYTPQ